MTSEWTIICIEGYCMYEVKAEENPGMEPPPYCYGRRPGDVFCPSYFCLVANCPHFGYCEAAREDDADDPEARAEETREAMREAYE